VDAPKGAAWAAAPIFQKGIRMKTKLLKFDDEEYRIGALTLEQVETFVKSKEGARPAEGRIVGDAVLQLIAESFNNAQSLPRYLKPEDKEWTIERVRKEIDLTSIDAIQTAIIDFAGLMPKPAGESKAAAE
jgi:hypothetical protein